MEGDKLNCDEEYGMLTTDMMLVKILLNSIISTEEACLRMYGLKQAGLLAQQLLENQSKENRYS